MQATQSSTASGTEAIRDNSGKFAALQHMSRALELGCDDDSSLDVETCEPVVLAAPVAEGAGLAHDAGNLLGALNLYSELLAMPGVLHDEHREYASELRLLSERSWAMIDRLVNHARNVTRDEPVATILLEIVERCRGLLGKIAGRKVEIGWDAGGFQPVKVSAEAVERIVTNLVKNAAEATPEDGTILVTVRGVVADGVRRVVMTVSDAGCGMSVETLKALRLGGISRKRGRGIGFGVVRELVAASGGSLAIASEPGVGTSVSVEWTALTQGASIRLGEGERITTERGTKTVLKAEAGWIACS